MKLPRASLSLEADVWVLCSEHPNYRFIKTEGLYSEQSDRYISCDLNASL